MSGGEQQMVAIGRAMMSAPDILMLDEPSLGLAPLLCKELFQNLARVRELQIGILLVEQNAKQSLAIADRGYLLENTRITHEDTAANLATDPAVQKAYLGAGASAAAVTTGAAAKASVQVLRAETSTDAPSASAFTTSKGEARRSADQQIGSSIEDLVSKAAQTSADSSVDHTLPNSFNGTGSGLGNNNTSGAGVTTNTETRATPRANSAAISPSVSGVSSPDVDRVILDIENAAKAARERASARTNSRSSPARKVASGKKSAADSNKQSNPINRDESDSKPPVIEVYKRPRVEVYRRRPSGDFERD